jgi:hypothetical protein
MYARRSHLDIVLSQSSLSGIFTAKNPTSTADRRVRDFNSQASALVQEIAIVELETDDANVDELDIEGLCNLPLSPFQMPSNPE